MEVCAGGGMPKITRGITILHYFWGGIMATLLRADVSKYRPEVYKREKSKILKKIHKVALGKLLT